MDNTQASYRFDQYTQIVRNDRVVGFKLDNNNFQFIFDQFSGWYDEQGKYYNSDAVESNPPQQSSDSEGQLQQKNDNSQQKLSSQLNSLNFKQDQNGKVQVIRNLNEIIQNYPQGEEILIFVSLQPAQQYQDKLIEEYLSAELKQEILVQKGQIIGVFTEQLANRLIQLQGSKIQHLQDKPTLYFDIQLFKCLHASISMSKIDLQNKFNQLNYQKNRDYANIQQEQYQKGKFQCFFQVSRNMADEIQDQIPFKVQN